MQAHPSLVADDDVVENLDAENLAGADEPARDAEILARRRRVAARVIVRRNDGRSVRQDGSLEYVARVYERCVERASADC